MSPSSVTSTVSVEANVPIYVLVLVGAFQYFRTVGSVGCIYRLIDLFFQC